MTELTQRQQVRADFRASLFQRRGVDAKRADELVQRLTQRDADRDDRIMCLECVHLQRSGHCFAAAQGWIAGAAKRMEPVKEILMRCERFEWVKP